MRMPPNSTAWLVAITTLVVVALCVVLHYEVLSQCNHLVAKLSHRRRPRVLFVIFIVLITHVVEIWLFASGYRFLVGFDGLGTLHGVEAPGLPDFFYYSATVYTTIGFGDLFPVGPLRFLSGIEALTGLTMITWSASFTFLEMQRDWRG
jgi:hypothetical protein